MKKLINYIQEALIKKNTVIKKESSSFRDEDFKYRVRTSAGKEYFWYKCWAYLWDHGPTRKEDLLKALGVKSSSYGTMFSDLSRKNIIVPEKRLWHAVDPKDWIKK